MRIAYLLLMGSIIPFFSCQTRSLYHQEVLEKYSYLLVGLKTTNTANGTTREINYSSGFFIRDINNKLFLVSAYHAFSDCELYKHIFRDERTDSMRVWYTDTAGKYTFQTLPLKTYKTKPCKSAAVLPDIDTMEVTAYFKDARINSIEELAPAFWQESFSTMPGDRLVCYGYFDEGLKNGLPKKGNPKEMPTGYMSKVVNMPGRIEIMNNYYAAVWPGFKIGFSGAPVFRVRCAGRRSRKIEFAGVQSGNDSTCPYSLIVQGKELARLIHWK